MDIVCPRCETEYEFEDSKVTDAGVTVKCTSCSYTFKVRRRADGGAATQTADQRMPGTPPGSAKADPQTKLWMVRTADGQVLRFKDLSTLQQWIVEHRVTREDQISRSGETWKRLGDIAELTTFFQLADAARADASRQRAVSTASGPTARQTLGPTTLGSGVPAHDEPAFAAASGSQFQAVRAQHAAWEDTSQSRVNLRALDEEDLLDGRVRRRPGRLVGLIVVLLVLGGVGAFAALKPDRFFGFFRGLFGSRSEVSESYGKGRELLLKGDENSLVAAEQQLSRQSTALSDAALAEVYTTWCQHLRDEAELLDRQALQLESKAEATLQDKDRARLLRLQAGKARDGATRRLALAETHAAKAGKAAPHLAEVNRALADVARLLGQPDARVLELLDKARKTAQGDSECLYVEGALRASRADAPKAVELLQQASQKQLLVRAAVALALVHARVGRRADALAAIDSVLRVNPAHGWAQQIKAQLDTLSAPVATPLVADGAVTRPLKPDAGAHAGTSAGSASAKVDKPAADPKRSTDPPLAGGYLDLVRIGDQLSQHGKTAKATKAYEAARKLKPQGVEALTGLGFCQLDMGRYSAAISLFRNALNASSTYGDAMIGMAEAYRALGNASKALDYYRAYLQAHPSGSKAALARRNATALEAKVGQQRKDPDPTPDKKDDKKDDRKDDKKDDKDDKKDTPAPEKKAPEPKPEPEAK